MKRKTKFNIILLTIFVFTFFQIASTFDKAMTKGDWFVLLIFEFALQALWELNKNKIN